MDRIDWENPVSDHPLNQDLVSWWLAGDENPYWGGPLFRDLCNRHHATLVNGPEWQGARGRQGGWGSLRFAHGFNTYASIADDSVFTTAPLSIAIWFRQETLAEYTLLHKGDGVTHAGSSILIVKTSIVDGVLGFWVNNGSGWAVASAVDEYADGAWHLLIGTFSGSQVKCYMDGVLKSTTAFTGTMNNDSNSIEVGWHSNAAVTDLTGSIGDMRFWRRELTASDVRQYHDLSRQGYPGLLNRLPKRFFFSSADTGEVFVQPAAIVSEEAFAPPRLNLRLLSDGLTSVQNELLEPDSDESVDGWLTEDDSSTDLYDAINDYPATTYIKSGADGDVFEVHFENPGGSTETAWVRYRLRKSGTGSFGVTVELIEDTTVLATWEHTDLTDDWVSYSQLITVAISDWTDVRLRFTSSIAS